MGLQLLRSNSGQIGNPTFTGDLVQQVLLLLDRGKTGIFNCVNGGVDISRFDYTSKIIQYSQLNIQVIPVNESYFKRRAAVSPNESAINARLIVEHINIMPSWDISLKRYIDLLKSSDYE